MNKIGFGTWQIPYEQLGDILQNAYKAGYRHFDTAAAYANEAGVADGLQKLALRRSDLYISNKLWVTKRGYDAAIKACKRSLKALRLDHFDQYLIHWPAAAAQYSNWAEINAETWRAMETMKLDGLVKNIGVCNFKAHHLNALMQSANIKPYVNQIEFHPGYFQQDTVSLCIDNGIKLEAWSPLGHGALLSDSTLKHIAEGKGVSVAQLCLAWCINHGALPITKTVSAERMRSNFAVSNIILSESDIAAIDSLPLCGYSGLDPDTISEYR